MCHSISIYCIKILPWYWNVYWYEDSWFCVIEMVHGVVALQEGYGIITYDIQRIDCGKCLCDATDIIIWYIVLLTVIFTKFNTGCTLYNKFCVSSFCTKSIRNLAFKFFRALILYLSTNCLVRRITKIGVWQNELKISMKMDDLRNWRKGDGLK